jgi:hypothetical protein
MANYCRAVTKSPRGTVVNLLKETAEIVTGMVKNYSWDQANRRQKHGLVWKKGKKISQIIKDYFYLLNYFMLGNLSIINILLVRT